MKRYLPLLLLLLLALPACRDASRPALPGMEAPDFSLTDLNGRKVGLAELRGKVVLLNFWASWCPPCREEVPSLARLDAAMAGSNFRMLAVSIDQGGRDAVEAYFRAAGVRLPTLLDPNGKVSKRYGITGVPETFVVDARGVIRQKVVGPIEWDAPDVVRSLRELANGRPGR